MYERKCQIPVITLLQTKKIKVDSFELITLYCISYVFQACCFVVVLIVLHLKDRFALSIPHKLGLWFSPAHNFTHKHYMKYQNLRKQTEPPPVYPCGLAVSFAVALVEHCFHCTTYPAFRSTTGCLRCKNHKQKVVPAV